MMGKTIIATDVGGNSEVVINHESGLLVSSKNVEELADRMLYALNNKRDAERMAKNARRRYKDRFDFDEIFRREMIDLYKGKG